MSTLSGLLNDLKDQQQQQQQQVEPEKKPKRKHKKKKHRHHKTVAAKLTSNEANMVHQNMLEQTIDNSNLPNAVSTAAYEAVPQATAPAPSPEDLQQQQQQQQQMQQDQQQQFNSEQAQSDEAQRQQQAQEDEARKQQQDDEEEEARKQEEEEEEARKQAEERRRRRKHKKLIKQALHAPEKGTRRTQPLTEDEKTTDNDNENDSESGSGESSDLGERFGEGSESLDEAAEYTTNNVLSVYTADVMLNQEKINSKRQHKTNKKQPLTTTVYRQTTNIRQPHKANRQQAITSRQTAFNNVQPKAVYYQQGFNVNPQTLTVHQRQSNLTTNRRLENLNRQAYTVYRQKTTTGHSQQQPTTLKNNTHLLAPVVDKHAQQKQKHKQLKKKLRKTKHVKNSAQKSAISTGPIHGIDIVDDIFENMQL